MVFSLQYTIIMLGVGESFQTENVLGAIGCFLNVAILVVMLRNGIARRKV